MDNTFKDKKVVIMGLGVNRGGLGAAKWLLKRGARLLVTDMKDRRALSASVAELDGYYRSLAGRGAYKPVYVLGRHRLDDFRKADLVIRNPGVPRESEFLTAARKRGVPVESDMTIFFRLCPGPIVGVSGTKGKTTVTTLIAAMLKEGFGRVAVGGNLRRSVLDELDGLMKSKKPAPVALELSSWQLEDLETVRKSPHIAVLTNVLPDHLNRYRGMADYAAAKELIYAFQGEEDAAIVPLDNPWTRKMGKRVRAERFWASMKEVPEGQNGLFFRGEAAVIREQGIETGLFRRGDVRLPGEHNLWNALLAAGSAYLRGARPADIAKALRKFPGVPYRLEPVRKSGGVGYWNDSAATTPEASVAAMKTLSSGKRGRRMVLIAGGADKELEFGAWAKAAKRLCRNIILFDGTALKKIVAALDKAGVRRAIIVRSMREAVDLAKRFAKAGDEVLLSPGCASFGLFVNEFDRGDKFRAAVGKLR